jgi:hypothetical protein
MGDIYAIFVPGASAMIGNREIVTLVELHGIFTADSHWVHTGITGA